MVFLAHQARRGALVCGSSMAALASALLVAGPAAAQDAGAGEPAVSRDEIYQDTLIVTAQKREQNIQDIGISVSSLSGDAIEKLGFLSTADIIYQVPSVKILSFSPSLTVFNIRGVSQNDFADHYEGPIGVFSDEAYISSQGAVNTAAFDLERIEVLRGPQGTLFGRNSTGGAIQYVSRKPTSEFEGYGRIVIGDYQQRNFDGAVSGPITDTLSARLSVSTVNNSGWVENRIGRDLNDTNNFAGRLQFLFEPSDSATFLLKFHGSQDDAISGAFSHRAAYPGVDGLGETVPDNVDIYGTCAGCDLVGYKNPDGVFSQAHDREGTFDRGIAGVTLKSEFDLGGAELTLITDYLYMDKIYGSDSDAGPVSLLIFDTDQVLGQFSQEARLSGGGEGFSWVAGAYYLNIRTDNQAIGTIDTLFPAPYTSVIDYNLDTDSFALFGQAEYDLTDTITVIGGLRYSYDKKTMDYALADTFGGSVSYNPATDPGVADKDFQNISAKAEIDWRPSDNVLLYASYNRGTKAGSYSAPLFLPFSTADLLHDEEVLTAYEIGTKLTLLDGLARLNASAYYYDYDDYQAFFLVNLSQNVANRDAEVKGFEIELEANPFDGFYLSAGLAHIDGEVFDITLPSGVIADRDLPMAPKWGLNGVARYSWPAFGGNLAVQADGNYSSAFNFYVTNPPLAQQKAYGVLNTRLSYTTSDERWEFAVQARNLTNTEYRLYTNDVSGLGVALDGYAPPRWVSGSITFSW